MVELFRFSPKMYNILITIKTISTYLLYLLIINRLIELIINAKDDIMRLFFDLFVCTLASVHRVFGYPIREFAKPGIR